MVVVLVDPLRLFLCTILIELRKVVPFILRQLLYLRIDIVNFCYYLVCFFSNRCDQSFQLLDLFLLQSILFDYLKL